MNADKSSATILFSVIVPIVTIIVAMSFVAVSLYSAYVLINNIKTISLNNTSIVRVLNNSIAILEVTNGNAIVNNTITNKTILLHSGVYIINTTGTVHAYLISNISSLHPYIMLLSNPFAYLVLVEIIIALVLGGIGQYLYGKYGKFAFLLSMSLAVTCMAGGALIMALFLPYNVVHIASILAYN